MDDEEMEIEDSSSAIVVDSNDLRNLAIPMPPDDDEEEGEDGSDADEEGEESVKKEFVNLQPVTFDEEVELEEEEEEVDEEEEEEGGEIVTEEDDSQDDDDEEYVPSYDHDPSTASPTRRMTRTSSTTSSLMMINPEEEVRKATTQYLQGEMTAAELATTMEEYEGLLKDDEEEDETETGEQQDMKVVPVPVQVQQRQPSLVLLNPEDVGNDREPPSSSQVEEVQSGLDKDKEEEEDNRGAKMRGEFFRTGDDLTTFTLRKKRKINPTIKNMMGEAHVRFARGDFKGAESICLEIIKEQPTYKDPFHTLAMIYENQGRVQKALQFFLISGLLDPKRFEDWPRLAELSVEEGNIPQAIMCLRKAIYADPTNVNANLRRCELMLELDDTKGALKGYYKVLQALENDGPAYLDLAKKVAAIHYKSNELREAYSVLLKGVARFSNIVTTIELNLLYEVSVSLKRYAKALSLFMKHSGVRFEPPVPKSSFRDRGLLTVTLTQTKRKCIVPPSLHADLVQKLCVVLIHLEAYDLAKPVVQKLRDTELLETFGIQLYEIAEAYLAKQQYEPSLAILTSLVEAHGFGLAEIWLRYAECLFLLNRVEESAEAYSKVIDLAPGHKIARLNLSVILQKLGRYEGALESLDQRSTLEELIDQDLLLEKCNILLSRNRINEFYEASLQLFTRHCPDLKNFDEAHALVLTSQTNQMLLALRSLRLRRGDPIGDDTKKMEYTANDGGIGEWTLYVNLFRILLRLNRPDLLCRITYTVWASTLFGKSEEMKRELDLQAAYASMLNGDTELTPIHLKCLIACYVYLPNRMPSVILQLISLASRMCGHSRYGRQIVRLLMKRSSDPRLLMMSANNSFMNSNYRYALMEYFALLKHKPDNPMIHLMVATTFLHLIAQRSTNNRAQLTAQAIAFITKYADLRGDSQEVYYNLGRFYHVIGLYKQAIGFYRRVLVFEPLDDRSQPDYNVSDLRREAAFNISQIYKSSGCWELAKRYIYQYCVI